MTVRNHALRIYAWDVASADEDTLRGIEDEVRGVADDAAVVTTCQRIEVLSLAPLLLSAPRHYEGDEALVHLAELASGLESLVLGETEVLGQVRAAVGGGPAELRHLAAVAISAARELRRGYESEQHTGHALDHALRLSNLSPGGRLLVIGAGAAGRRLVERGLELGFEVTVAARREPEFAGASFMPFEDVSSITPVDVIVACLGRGAPSLGYADLPRIASLAIDLGTPRKLRGEFKVPLIDTATLLASLRCEPAWIEQREHLRSRLHELLARRIDHAEADAQTPIGYLRSEIETIRRREIERALRLHPELSPETLQVVTASLVNQILHRPSLRLRQEANQQLARDVAELFAPLEARNGHI